MSSTNKTAKLGLSQFLGTDKPAWLGDYNSDMQKIDDAFADLEQGSQSSAADIAALQQKDADLTQDIADVNDRVDTVSADVIAVGNRTTVLEGNYDTMHHELALSQADIVDIKSTLVNNSTFKTQTLRDVETDVATVSLARIERIGNVAILNVEFVLKAGITATGWTEVFPMSIFADVIQTGEHCPTSASTYAISSNISDTYSRVAAAILEESFRIYINSNGNNPTANTRAAITFFIV